MMTNTSAAPPLGGAQTPPADIGQPAPQPISPKQLEANRLNALKSTGPKTPRGRAVSKMNALKHGIFSTEVLVHAWTVEESSREFSALHERFWQDLNPLGPVEEMLVDQIVTTHWRWRRALAAESGEIALSADEVPSKLKEQRQWARARWQALPDPIAGMEDSSLGVQVLQKRLGDLRAVVEQKGELTKAALHNFVQCFGGETNRLTRRLEDLRLKSDDNPDGLEPAALRDRNKQQALAFLDKQLKDLAWRQGACAEREEIEERSRQAAAVLPPMPVLEKFIRYETKLERQLYRALAHLERLQRMRQGEPVPPPLTVEVSP